MRISFMIRIFSNKFMYELKNHNKCSNDNVGRFKN